MNTKFEQPIGNPIEPKLKGKCAILAATGPSILDQVENINKLDIPIITVNNSFELFPKATAHISCNDDWWEYYWKTSKTLRELSADKYTWYKHIAEKFNIKYIKAIVKDGLSLDPRIIHINHGSGPMGINLALHLGVSKLLLVGHDMKFAEDYNGRLRIVGKTPRHFFGEYPSELQHWPSVKIGLSKPGVIDGLIEAYEKMVPYLTTMEVVNCTPNSALNIFRKSTLEKEI